MDGRVKIPEKRRGEEAGQWSRWEMMGPECNRAKCSRAHGTESQTLTAGVCVKVRVYCRAPSKGVGDEPQIHSR